jgi:hypothetical protein
MVALESPAKIPRHNGGKTETERAKLPLPRARQKPQTTATGGCRSGAREGNHSGVFSATAATVPDAMKGSIGSRDHLCRGSAHTNAGAPWSAFGSGNGIGGSTDNERVPDDLEIVPPY